MPTGLQSLKTFNFSRYFTIPAYNEQPIWALLFYALDRRLELEPGKRREEILEAIEGHVIDEAELMGRYKRLADR